MKTIPAGTYARLAGFAAYCDTANFDQFIGRLHKDEPADAPACFGTHYARYAGVLGCEWTPTPCQTIFAPQHECAHCGAWYADSEDCECAPADMHWWTMGREMMMLDTGMSCAELSDSLAALIIMEDDSDYRGFSPWGTLAWPADPAAVWRAFLQQFTPAGKSPLQHIGYSPAREETRR